MDLRSADLHRAKSIHKIVGILCGSGLPSNLRFSLWLDLYPLSVILAYRSIVLVPDLLCTQKAAMFISTTLLWKEEMSSDMECKSRIYAKLPAAPDRSHNDLLAFRLAENIGLIMHMLGCPVSFLSPYGTFCKIRTRPFFHLIDEEDAIPRQQVLCPHYNTSML